MGSPFRSKLVLAMRVVLLAIVLVLCVRGPQILWRILPARRAVIVILDKTAAFKSYREHKLFVWLLGALRIRKPDGRLYEVTDYRGFDPVSKRGTDLTRADLEDADALFIADTYGVYAGDFAQPGEIAATERSRCIYGGVTDEESRAIELMARRGGLVIGEFNAFDSPTTRAPRARLEATFGVRWTGWVGRYWRDLADDTDVPKWLRDEHERVYHEPLEHEGSALVFVREDGDLVVLRPGIDLEPEVLVIQRTEEAPDLKGLPRRTKFTSWIDVVEVTNADVVYEYELQVNDLGSVKLGRHGIHTRFPAVSRRHGLKAWYFAGDFIGMTLDPGDPHRAGILWWKKVTNGEPDADGGLFWGWYAPLLTRLLERELR